MFDVGDFGWRFGCSHSIRQLTADTDLLGSFPKKLCDLFTASPKQVYRQSK